MHTSVRKSETFPSVRLPSYSDGLPVEVSLIAQLGPGGGDGLIADAMRRQRAHAEFVDALDEPSARLGGTDLGRGDATSLYSFAVGANGHPFHRHAGHRMFTAVSGSAGARLRFSTASTEQVARDPRHFAHALRQVDIPPDSLFTVRFGGGTWHQFLPLRAGRHAALFALSCHANELGGDLPDQARERVLHNRADIPALTELLPVEVRALLDSRTFDAADVPTYALSLDAPQTPHRGPLRAGIHGALGHLRAWRQGGRARPSGDATHAVLELRQPPADSLLRGELADGFDHQDCFELVLPPGEVRVHAARTVMAALLEGFLHNRPRGVSSLMRLRNALVKPFGLRTSPLGCPVSSLLAQDAPLWFDDRYPVLAQREAADRSRVEVVLGADDRHLRFRSCVGVEVCADRRVVFSLGTRVRTHNLFGRWYLGAIDRVHRGYITPAMLRSAVAHATAALAPVPSPAEAASSGDMRAWAGSAA